MLAEGVLDPLLDAEEVWVGRLESEGLRARD